MSARILCGSVNIAVEQRNLRGAPSRADMMARCDRQAPACTFMRSLEARS